MMTKPFIYTLAALGCLTASQAAAAPVNLITNGDFEAGDTGFTSDFAVGFGAAATYAILTNPAAKNSAFATYGDNTSGTGNMMVVNGSTSGGDTVWSQVVSVIANTDYIFSAFIASAFPSAPATVEFNVNGTALGTKMANSTTGVWEEASFTWNSGSDTTATVSLIELSNSFGGNDYTLDDISFTAAGPTPPPIPLPAGGVLLMTALAGLALHRRKT